MIPQILVLVVVVIGLMANSYMHGKPRKGIHSVWPHLIGALINMSVLYWGGFFNPLFH